MHGEAGQLFTQILILLGTSTLLITLFSRLRLSPLLAFLLVGAIYGPTGLQLVTDAEELSAIGELGLSFLLFMLGLEFSLPRLYALRHTVFKVGGIQVGLCTLFFTLIFYWWGMDWITAVLVGGGLSLSSTAVVSRELSSLGRLHTRYGEISIGVLLFQDLAAVALLIAVPLAGSQQGSFSPAEVAVALVQSAALLAVFFLTARFLLPRLLREIARQKSDELLVLTALVIVLLAATLTASIGLSMELGAFLAGMMLGDTRFRHQLEVDIRPFRDLFLGLFFITIGMLIDIAMLQEYWFRILLSGLGLLLFKAAIISLIARLLGEAWRAALIAGLVLAQGGEFLFALMALSTRNGLLTQNIASFLISITIVSMVMTPVIIRRGPQLVDALLQRFNQDALQEKTEHLAAITGQHREQHVVILGFGRVGQTIARFLRPLGIDYVVLETDDVRIAAARTAGEPVYYGDASRLDILKTAAVDSASVVVISFDDAEIAAQVLRHIHELNPDIPILTRTRDDSNLEQLLELGATEVIPETHEASLTLVSHLLLILNIPTRRIHGLIDQARRDRYRLLKGFYHGERLGFLKRADRGAKILHAVRLTGNARASGSKLKELTLPGELLINEVQRDNRPVPSDQLDDLVLRRDDVIILQGGLHEVGLGEAYLLTGKS